VPSFVVACHTSPCPRKYSSAPRGAWSSRPGFGALLGFGPDDRLIGRLEDDRLILEKREAIRRRLKDRFARLPVGKSLASELLAERRREAEREEG
jgi:hypothetical protein